VQTYEATATLSEESFTTLLAYVAQWRTIREAEDSLRADIAAVKDRLVTALERTKTAVRSTDYADTYLGSLSELDPEEMFRRPLAELDRSGYFLEDGSYNYYEDDFGAEVTIECAGFPRAAGTSRLWLESYNPSTGEACFYKSIRYEEVNLSDETEYFVNIVLKLDQAGPQAVTINVQND
jgi:hypothetical protein